MRAEQDDDRTRWHPEVPVFKIPRYFELRRRAFLKIPEHLVTKYSAKLGAVVCIRQCQFQRKPKKTMIHNFNPLKFYVYLDYFVDVGIPTRVSGRYFLYDIENPVDDFLGELRAVKGLTGKPDFRFTGVWLKEREFAANFRVMVEPTEIVLKRRKKVVATEPAFKVREMTRSRNET